MEVHFFLQIILYFFVGAPLKYESKIVSVCHFDNLQQILWSHKQIKIMETSQIFTELRSYLLNYTSNFFEDSITF